MKNCANTLMVPSGMSYARNDGTSLHCHRNLRCLVHCPCFVLSGGVLLTSRRGSNFPNPSLLKWSGNFVITYRSYLPIESTMFSTASVGTASFSKENRSGKIHLLGCRQNRSLTLLEKLKQKGSKEALKVDVRSSGEFLRRVTYYLLRNG